MCGDVDLEFGWHWLMPTVEFVGLFGESDGSAHGCGQYANN